MIGFWAILLLIGLLILGGYNIVNTKNKVFKAIQIVLMVLMPFFVLMFFITLEKPVKSGYKKCLHGAEYTGEDDEYYYVKQNLGLFDRHTYCIEKRSSKKSALVSNGSLVNVFYNTEVAKPHQGQTIITDAQVKLDSNLIFLFAGIVLTGVFCVIQVGVVIYHISRKIKKL